MEDEDIIQYNNQSTRRKPVGGTRFDTSMGSSNEEEKSDLESYNSIALGTVTGDGTEEIVTNSQGKEVKEALDENNNPLGFKEGAFNNDGRSDTKFQQRINKAENEGRFGKKQRLLNRHANFLKNQGEKAVRAGGTLDPTQQAKVDEAQGKAKGTKIGNFLREKPITGAVKDAGAFVKSLFK